MPVQSCEKYTATLSEILAITPAVQTVADATDVPGVRLEWMKTTENPTGAWYGDLGTMPKAAADALYASGALANLATGATYRDTSGVPSVYTPGVGWVAQNLKDPSIAGDVAIFGNSIIEQNGGRFVQGLTDYYNSAGFVNVAAIRSAGRVRIVENWGIGGQNSTDLLNRIQQVTSSPAGTIVVCEVTNDSGRGLTAAQVWPNYVAIANAIIASGKTCIMCTGIPKSTMNAATLQFYAELNALILGHSVSGYIACDVATPLRDPDTGLAIAKVLRDGVHPNANGAYLMSGPLVAIFNAIAPPRNIINKQQSANRNLLANPFITSTGTSAPASWNMQGAPTGWSQVARTDGKPGTASKATCAAGTGFLITQNIDVATMPSRTPVRAYVRLKAENLEPAPAANTQSIQVYFQFYNGSSFSGRS